MGLGTNDGADVREMPEASDAPDADAVNSMAATAVPQDGSEAEGGLSAMESISPQVSSAAPVENRESDSSGLSAQAPKSDDHGLGVAEDDSEGLPETSAPTTTPPVVKLDYGVAPQQSHLVDLYG